MPNHRAVEAIGVGLAAGEGAEQRGGRIIIMLATISEALSMAAILGVLMLVVGVLSGVI